MSSAAWRAGASTRVIEVPTGTPLDGYGARQGTSTGTLRPLEVNCLYLQAEEGSALLLSLDLLSVDGAWVDALRERLQQQLGVRQEAVFVAASHTHSGPAGFRRPEFSPVGGSDGGAKLREAVAFLVLEAACEAAAGATEATLAVSRAAVGGVAANRQDPSGPADSQLTTIAVKREDGQLLALVWHFACHPTVLDAKNLLVSPDLPGEVRHLLRTRLGPSLPVLYLNGAAADVSTRFTRQASGLQEAQRLARPLADAVAVGGRPLDASRPIGRLAQCRLPAVAAMPEEVAEGLVAQSEQALAAARSGDSPTAVVRLREVELMGARKRLARSRITKPESLTAQVQVLSLGDLALVGFPGELYAREGFRAAEASHHAVTLVVGYAGDYIGYLPPADDKRGYERDSAWVAAGAVEQLLDIAAHLLEEVKP